MKIAIDLASGTPIYQQIRDQIILGVGSGELKYGENLPSARQLAEDLGINSMTVNKAYQTLKQEGVIVVDRRVGTKVRENPEQMIEAEYIQRLEIMLAEGLAKTNDQQQFQHIVKELLDKLLEGR
ncbi:GntR family transcriptional regulator [Fundicoccus culcitae]|uniref:GntR family transcriptional regulator n=1 Tax=Fundicoccus culcitae TaxID=2969821 RepID=A0ABY5P598_9LACT|nr:GntR family transcriptional regulator [Fundicoccus culcitae]UUX33583.1 GntR family transcriptional regulator [Fundicoccus culcitae]